MFHSVSLIIYFFLEYNCLTKRGLRKCYHFIRFLQGFALISHFFKKQKQIRVFSPKDQLFSFKKPHFSLFLRKVTISAAVDGKSATFYWEKVLETESGHLSILVQLARRRKRKTNALGA